MEEIISAINANIEIDKDAYQFGNFTLDCKCNKTYDELAKLEHQGKCCIIGNIYCCKTVQCLQEIKSRFQHIDRLNNSEEEKPRIWPCQFCHIRKEQTSEPVKWEYSSYTSRHNVPTTLLGGGCEWYSYNEVDCCMDCWNSLSLEQFSSLDFEEDKTYFQTERSMEPIPFLKCGKIETLQNSILHNIEATLEGLEDFKLSAELIKSVGHFPDDIVEMCGINSLKENIFCWIPICEVTDMPLCDSTSSLFMNIADKNFPVASAVWDDHHRLSLVRIFNSFDDCLQEYKNWKSTKLTDDEIDEIDEEDEELGAKISKDFSSYVRFKNNLGIYFG